MPEQTAKHRSSKPVRFLSERCCDFNLPQTAQTAIQGWKGQQFRDAIPSYAECLYLAVQNHVSVDMRPLFGVRWRFAIDSDPLNVPLCICRTKRQ